MSDDRSNWARAVACYWPAMIPITIEDLVAIGRALSVSLAKRAYDSLRDEPRDEQGEKVDWLVIRARILGARAAQ